MNIYAMSSIVQCNKMQFENILRYVEGRSLLKPKLPMRTKKRTNDDNNNNDKDIDGDENTSPLEENNNMIVVVSNNDYEEEEEEDIILYADYMISSSRMVEILQHLDLHASDIYIFQNLFILADKRGYDLVDLKDLLTLFSIVIATSVLDCLQTAIMIHDRKLMEIVEKSKLLHVFTLLNESCCYFGDKFLSKTQLLDLADSIYTNAGKIDGDIVYMDFLPFMAEHPIVEMLISPQFQGTVIDKYLDDEAFGNMIESGGLVVDI
jgi:hypothetical protein